MMINQWVLGGALVFFGLLNNAPFSYAEAKDQSTPAETQAWELIDDVDGIKSFRKEIPGSPLVAFKGEGLVNAPLPKVAQVIMDFKRSTEWIDRLVENKRLDTPNQLDYIDYTHVSTPFIVKDREFVTLIHVDVDVPHDRVRFTIRSINDTRAPRTEYVRGEVMESGFVLESRDQGKSTYVVGQVHADPKGNLPKWLVNLVQKSWARNTLTALRKQVEKPDILEQPVLAKLFAPRMTKP